MLEASQAVDMTEDQVEEELRKKDDASKERKAALRSLVLYVKAQREAMTEYEVDAVHFVALVKDGMRCIDVRSPGEYARGHIPGAINVPLFSNEDRARVGRCYKNSGREIAMALGMSKVANRGIDTLAQEAQGGDTRVCLHCWRGGLRSGAVAWLLRRRGVIVYSLCGGYRAFRRYARSLWTMTENRSVLYMEEKEEVDDVFSLEECVDSPSLQQEEEEALFHSKHEQPRIIVLGGRTGVGKTRVLQELRNCGEQVLDLEALASHRGSAFGYLEKQPTNEMFENLLAMQWLSLDPRRRVWIEDEEGHVGKCHIPPTLYSLIQSATCVLRLTASIETRVSLLLSDYLSDPSDDFVQYLISTTTRLAKRLGGQRHKHAIELAQNRDFPAFTELLLIHYYDKLYDKHMAKKKLAPIDVPVVTSPQSPHNNSVYDAAATAHHAIAALADQPTHLNNLNESIHHPSAPPPSSADFVQHPTSSSSSYHEQ